MIKKLLTNPVFSGVFIVTLGSFIGSIFSYLLQLFLGRSLSVVDFGTFSTLLSLSAILGVLGAAFSNSVVKKVTALKALCDFETLTDLFWKLSFWCLLFGAFFAILLFSARQLFADFFHISDTQALVAFSFFMGLTFLGSLPRAYLQGLLRFKALAFFTVATAFLRLAFPVGAVIKGFGVDGVFGGMVLGSLLSYVVSFFLLKKNFRACERNGNLSEHYRTILNFIGPIIFLQVGLTLLNNLDIILVKRLFDPESAGIYAGVVTVGKVLLFGAGSVSTIMFPLVAEAFSKGEDPKKELKKFLPIQLSLVIAGCAVFAFFPRLVTVLMFGEKYIPAVQYVPLFSGFVALNIMINFFILYFMAVEKFKVAYILGLGVMLQAFLIWMFSDSLSSVVFINFCVAGVVLGVLAVYYKRVRLQPESQQML